MANGSGTSSGVNPGLDGRPRLLHDGSWCRKVRDTREGDDLLKPYLPPADLSESA